VQLVEAFNLGPQFHAPLKICEIVIATINSTLNLEPFRYAMRGTVILHAFAHLLFSIFSGDSALSVPSDSFSPHPSLYLILLIIQGSFRIQSLLSPQFLVTLYAARSFMMSSKENPIHPVSHLEPPYLQKKNLFFPFHALYPHISMYIIGVFVNSCYYCQVNDIGDLSEMDFSLSLHLHFALLEFSQEMSHFKGVPICYTLEGLYLFFRYSIDQAIK